MGAPRAKKKSFWELFVTSPVAGPLATLIIIGGAFAAFVPHFASIRSVSGIINAATLTGMVTIGVTLLMIAGEFDLSVGSVVAIGAYAFAYGTLTLHSPLIAVLLALTISSLLGLINGLIFVKTGIPSFIVTLGTLYIYRGVVWLISGGQLIQTTQRLGVYNIFNGRLDVLNALIPGANFRTSLLWLLGMTAFFQYVLVRTAFGNHVFAAGGNARSAMALGVNVRRVKVVAFVISSFMAGLTGILLFSQFRSVRVATGAGMELAAIAAAVVGGTLLTGGAGSIWGALIGALLISTLRTGVILMNLPFIPADNFEAVVGVTIIGAVILNNWLRNRQ